MISSPGSRRDVGRRASYLATCAVSSRFVSSRFVSSRFVSSLLVSFLLIFFLLIGAPQLFAIDPCAVGRIVGSQPQARAGHAVAADDIHFAIGVPGLDTVWMGTLASTTGGNASISWIIAGPPDSRFGSALTTVDGEWFVGAPDDLPGGAVHRIVFDPDPTVVEVLRPPLATAAARAGSSLGAAEDLLVVGAHDHGPSSAPSGAVFPYRRIAAVWTALPPVFPPDGHVEGGFGEAVATDGLHVAVGAPRAPGAASECGSVAVLRLLPTDLLAPLAIVIHPDGQNDDGCGAAVEFGSGDLAIGIPHRTPMGATLPGGGVVQLVAASRIAAWSVAIPGAVPVLFADTTLARTAAPPAAGFGSALAFSGDRWWIGSPADGSIAPLAGAVTGFEPTGTAIDDWTEGSTFFASAPAAGAKFGGAIAPSDAGLGIGLPGDPTGCGGGFGCAGGAAEFFVESIGSDCDGDNFPDRCALFDDPTLDLDGDGALDRCRFRRGDIDGDATFDLADPIAWLAALASAGAEPIGGTCPGAWNTNGDTALDLADPIYLLQYLFVSGSAPPPPFPDCGFAPIGGRFPCSTGCAP